MTKRNSTPEGDLCERFFSRFKERRSDARHPGKFLVVKVSNEQPRLNKDLDDEHVKMGAMLKRMGRIPGVYDYLIIYSDDGGPAKFAFMEAKAPGREGEKNGGLTDKQLSFKFFLDLCEIPNTVFYSLEEAWRFIESLKILKINIDTPRQRMVF